MAMIDALLPEFDHEIAVTRKVLERVPDDKLSWKPHPTSLTFGELATHVTNLPMWGEVTVAQSEIDLPSDTRDETLPSRAALLEQFDRHAAAARAALAGRSDAELLAPWTLKADGKAVFTMPKAVVWRSFVMSHLVHHRAQLGVYLRMNDLPVPSMYGPSADENPF